MRWPVWAANRDDAPDDSLRPLAARHVRAPPQAGGERADRRPIRGPGSAAAERDGPVLDQGLRPAVPPAPGRSAVGGDRPDAGQPQAEMDLPHPAGRTGGMTGPLGAPWRAD